MPQMLGLWPPGQRLYLGGQVRAQKLLRKQNVRYGPFKIKIKSTFPPNQTQIITPRPNPSNNSSITPPLNPITRIFRRFVNRIYFRVSKEVLFSTLHIPSATYFYSPPPFFI
uniref:Uncharacterized protein n=1 Tax=Cacopsylla melanoneura TaxID=428564 RepID=A0A8D8VRE6_9HEMI